MATTVDEKDRIRALVLHAFYDVNERMPGNVEQTGIIADRTKLPKTDVDRATIYLAERNLISISQNEGYLGSTDRIILASITSHGVDVIERPEERGPDFLELGVIKQIINVNGTYVASGATVYQGGQQIVGRDNTGVMVNASTTDDIQPPATSFPIEKLRAILAEGSDERRAAEDLAAEAKSPKPKMSIVSRAIEVLKSTTKFADAVATITAWLNNTDVMAWLHTLTDHLQL